MHVKFPSEIRNRSFYKLHGRAIVVMPNLFVIAATFNHNRIEKDKKLHFMLQNHNRADKNFERTLGPNFPLMVKNSQAINNYLVDNESLINAAVAHA